MKFKHDQYAACNGLCRAYNSAALRLRSTLFSNLFCDFSACSFLYPAIRDRPSNAYEFKQGNANAVREGSGNLWKLSSAQPARSCRHVQSVAQIFKYSTLSTFATTGNRLSIDFTGESSFRFLFSPAATAPTYSTVASSTDPWRTRVSEST